MFFRKVQSVYSTISLIVANLLPLYGVLFWGWNVFSLMFLYWSESVIIAVFTVLKMRKAEGTTIPDSYRNVRLNGRPLSTFGQDSEAAKRAFFIPFFSLHFGIFTFVHGIFVLAFFYSKDANWLGIFLSFLSLCLSHFISYKSNFLGQEEYKHVSVERLFMAPYPRIFVMHITVILGGIFATSQGQPIGALVLMVILKIIADLGSHWFEHRKI